MKIKLFYTFLFFSTIMVSQEQQLPFVTEIDSLLSAKTAKPFNGIVLIAQKGKIKYSKTYGYSNIDTKEKLELDDQFVIGSISKQFTAVLVLEEFDKGQLDLSSPIRKYLPELKQSWADTVTVHHLLTHLHGITEIDKPTSFKVGTQYSYSQIGYDLLAQIIEKTSGKSFAELAQHLFAQCGMKNTFHPDSKQYHKLVKGYTERENGLLEFEKNSLKNYVAAGTFIATAKDLELWNKAFYGGKLLKKETMTMLLTKQEGAVRKHPIFGATAYGYGITIDTQEQLTQLGQTGFTPGFVSMNYYYPETQTSVIALENIAYETDDIKKTFFYHTAILKIIRKNLKH